VNTSHTPDERLATEEHHVTGEQNVPFDDQSWPTEQHGLRR